MRHITKGLLISIVCLFIGLLLRYLAASKETPLTVPMTATQPPPIQQEEHTQRFTATIKAGDTLSDLLKTRGAQPQEISQIIACSKKIYNLTKLHAGKTITLTFDQCAQSIVRLEYGYDDDQLLIVSKTEGGYRASQEKILRSASLRSVSGTITSSLFDDAVRAGCPTQLIVKFADIFAWDIDFFTSVREKDEFKLLFEEFYQDGTVVKHGKILAAEFINRGKKYRAFSFGAGLETSGYYDDRGQSVAREFLKNPLRYSRIS